MGIEWKDLEGCGQCFTSSWTVNELGERICLCCFMRGYVVRLSDELGKKENWIRNMATNEGELLRLREIERQSVRLFIENNVLKAKLEFSLRPLAALGLVNIEEFLKTPDAMKVEGDSIDDSDIPMDGVTEPPFRLE